MFRKIFQCFLYIFYSLITIYALYIIHFKKILIACHEIQIIGFFSDYWQAFKEILFSSRTASKCSKIISIYVLKHFLSVFSLVHLCPSEFISGDLLLYILFMFIFVKWISIVKIYHNLFRNITEMK